MKKINFISLLVLLMLYSCDNEVGLSDIKTSKDVGKHDISEFNVSQKEAIRIADMFHLKENNISMQSKMQSSVETLKEVFTIRNEKDVPCMHVINYNNNGGFVIISATQKYLPVLAYSDKGNFL